jgi:simple sugar transport system permease protein
MLIGAFTAASVGFYTKSAWLGWMAAGLAGVILSFLIAWLNINRKADQVVVGMAVNLLVMGLVPFLSKIIFDSTGSTPSMELQDRFTFEPLLMGFMAVVLVHFLFSSTQLGLWISFAGEKPETLISNGISVTKTRWFSVLLGGALAAWGGASLSVFLASAYSPQMTSGRGFMALAALILGKWKPGFVLLACLFFGLTEAIQIRLQGVPVMGVVLPVQWVQMIPYVVTVIALAGFLGRSRPPQALGQK